VSAGWRLAEDAEAPHFLLAARGGERVMLLDGLERRVNAPDQPCDFVERSPNQRNYSVKIMGRFVVTYWLDLEKIVRVVRIRRIKDRSE
jgi:hypothetical protein